MTEITPRQREQEASVHAEGLGLCPLRFENGKPLVIAGLNERYNDQTRVNIPAQWQRFATHIGKVPGQIGGVSYGVCWNVTSDGEFDYLAGVEMAESAKPPQGFTSLRIGARRYAVVTHAGPVSTLPQTIDTIWSRWAPESGLKIAHAPCFERYTEDFDPNGGGMEVWIPLEQ